MMTLIIYLEKTIDLLVPGLKKVFSKPKAFKRWWFIAMAQKSFSKHHPKNRNPTNICPSHFSKIFIPFCQSWFQPKRQKTVTNKLHILDRETESTGKKNFPGWKLTYVHWKKGTIFNRKYIHLPTDRNISGAFYLLFVFSVFFQRVHLASRRNWTCNTPSDSTTSVDGDFPPPRLNGWFTWKWMGSPELGCSLGKGIDFQMNQPLNFPGCIRCIFSANQKKHGGVFFWGCN